MATGLNEQWFKTTDNPGVAGPPRELVGYGEFPPKITWPGGAKVAIQIILNYEEGSEKTYAMGDDFNEDLYELPYKQEGMRDLAIESAYEYGSRAGVWRQFRVFANAMQKCGLAFVEPRQAEEINARYPCYPTLVLGYPT